MISCKPALAGILLLGAGSTAMALAAPGQPNRLQVGAHVVSPCLIGSMPEQVQCAHATSGSDHVRREVPVTADDMHMANGVDSGNMTYVEIAL